MLRRLLALAAALPCACATTVVEEWEPVRATSYVADDGSFGLELPAGWRRSGQRITRDGPEVQSITFNAGDVLDPEQGVDLAAPEMLQAMEDTLASQPGVTVVELGPATLDGLSAFRMHFTFAAEPAEGGGAAAPRREGVIYGAVDGATLYALSFEAADGARFALDLPVFERLVASFARRRPPAP